MKKSFAILLILLFGTTLISGQSAKTRNTVLGKWKYEAPNAPEGYTSGTIEISFTDNKYVSLIVFEGSDYKVQGDRTKVENDTVSFVVFVEGNEVSVSLKAENDTKMTGKAVYSEGEIPLSLTRENARK